MLAGPARAGNLTAPIVPSVAGAACCAVPSQDVEAVLSGLATADLVQAIRGAQIEMLVRIPGVGKKTAERMVVELRDKLDGLLPGKAAVSASAPAVLSAVEQDVMSALVNLGCNRALAEGAIQKAKAAGAPAEFEPLFRRSMEFIR